MPTLSLNLVDPDRDDNRCNPDAHWRLYDHPEKGPCAVLVQEFDYPDYDGTRFLNYDAYTTTNDASEALRVLALTMVQLAERFRAAGLLA